MSTNTIFNIKKSVKQKYQKSRKNKLYLLTIQHGRKYNKGKKYVKVPYA